MSSPAHEWLLSFGLSSPVAAAQPRLRLRLDPQRHRSLLSTGDHSVEESPSKHFQWWDNFTAFLRLRASSNKISWRPDPVDVHRKCMRVASLARENAMPEHEAVALVHAANALFSMEKGEDEGARLADSIAGGLETDPEFVASRDEMRVALANLKADRAAQHSWQMRRFKHAANPVASPGESFADADSVARDALFLGRPVNRALAKAVTLKFTAEEIKLAFAAQTGIDPAVLDQHFSDPNMTPREALNRVILFRGLENHRHDTNLPAQPISKSLGDVSSAYDSLCALAARLRADPHAVTPDDVIDSIKEVHTHLTAGARYQKLPPKTPHGMTHHIYLPGGQYRDVICGSGSLKIMYTHPSEIPAEMHKLASLLLEEVRAGRSGLALSGWLFHALVMVHPFADGNGRTSRLVAALPSLIANRSLVGFEVGADVDRRVDYLERCDMAEGVSFVYAADGTTVVHCERTVPVVEPLVRMLAQDTGSMLDAIVDGVLLARQNNSSLGPRPVVKEARIEHDVETPQFAMDGFVTREPRTPASSHHHFGEDDEIEEDEDEEGSGYGWYAGPAKRSSAVVVPMPTTVLKASTRPITIQSQLNRLAAAPQTGEHATDGHCSANISRVNATMTQDLSSVSLGGGAPIKMPQKRERRVGRDGYYL